MATASRSDAMPRSRWTLRFHGRGLERAFLEHHSRVAAQHQRLAAAAGVPAFLLGIFWLRWLAPDVAEQGARLLIAGPVVVLALTFLLSFVQLSDAARQLTACLDIAATTGAVLLIMQEAPSVTGGPLGGDAQLTLQVAGVPALFLILLVSVTYVRLRFLWSLVASPAFVAAYVVAATNADIDSTVIAANAVAFGGAAAFGISLSYLLESGERHWWFDQLRIEEQRRRADDLLHSILPPPIARRVHAGERHIADRHASVTVLFADLVGFTRLADTRPPGEMLDILDALMRAFDGVADAHGLEKIKTVGDAYMAVAGAPEPVDDHADRALAAGLDMIRATVRVSGEIGFPLQVRVGLDSGPLVAGIIGERKPMYDLWGDTVNTASRMESHGVPGAVQMTDAVRDALRDVPPMRSRVVDVKGKGEMRTWVWHPAAGNAHVHGSGVDPSTRIPASADWGTEARS